MLNSLVNVTNETSPEINSALNFLIKQLLVFSLVQTTTLIFQSVCNRWLHFSTAT